MDTTSITNSRSTSLISYLRNILQTDNAAATDTTTTPQVDDTSNNDTDKSCGSSTNASYTSGTLSINSDILALLMQSQQAGSTDTSTATTKLDDVFKKIDANGDGKVTLQEFEASAPSTMDKATADKLYAQIDAQGTGSFTEDDLKTSIGTAVQASGGHHHHHHHGGGDVAGAPPSPPNGAASLDDLFKTADTDGDGKLSLDEFEKALGKKTADASSADVTASASASASTSGSLVVNTPAAFLQAIKSYLTAFNVDATATTSASLDAVVG